jgi:hypothetical protein
VFTAGQIGTERNVFVLLSGELGTGHCAALVSAGETNEVLFFFLNPFPERFL